MLIAILVIAGIGFVGALALALADRFLAVREDPRIGLVSAALPAKVGIFAMPGRVSTGPGAMQTVRIPDAAPARAIDFTTPFISALFDAA